MYSRGRVLAEIMIAMDRQTYFIACFLSAEMSRHMYERGRALVVSSRDSDPCWTTPAAVDGAAIRF